MSWTPGKDWATAEIVTVWKLQTYWTDQLLSLRNLNDHACHVSAASSPPFDVGTSGVIMPVPWRHVDWQIGTEIFSTQEPTKFKAPVPGWYELIPTIVWSTASGGTRTLSYRLNGGSPNYDLHALQTNNNSFHPGNNGIDIVQMSTVDSLEVIILQDGGEEGIAVVANNSQDNTRCSWRLIGAAS